MKAPILLEEIGLPHEEAYRVKLEAGAREELSPEFLLLNPDGKTPTILAPSGLGWARRALALFESSAILVGTWPRRPGRCCPLRRPRATYATLRWLMFQVGGGGPMVGRLGFSLKFAGRDYEDKDPRERYAAESRLLLLDALNQRLERRRWPTGENYTVHCR